MFTVLLLYSILPLLTLAQNTPSDEVNEYKQDLWPYLDSMEYWPNQLSSGVYYDPHLKRWASQLRFGKRASWASKVRFG